MRSKSVLFLSLLILVPLASAEWVRFEAEDAVLSAENAEIQDYADASGGKAVFLLNGPAGTIDFVVNVRDAATVGMRIAFYSNDNVSQKYDSIYVNGVQHIDQNWGCGYYWDPVPKPANFEDYRDSIVPYGSEVVFQILSRWWPAWNEAGRNLPMTVPLEAGTNTIQIESGWSWTTYDYIELDLPETAFNPDPADGDTEVRSTQATLSWENPAGVLVNKVYFGQSDTEPNYLNYPTLLTTVIDIPSPGATPSIAMPGTLEDGKDYYWVMDSDDINTVMPPEPNLPGVIWHFATQFNAAPDISIQSPLAYLGQGGNPGEVTVFLDAAVTDDGLPNPPGAITSYAWTYLSGAASVSKSAGELAALTTQWWGDSSLNSATIITTTEPNDTCRYSVELSGTMSDWGEEIRLVNWDDGGLQAGDTWKQKFACPASNPYSVEVTMYYYIAGDSEGGTVTAVLNPGEEAILALPITEPVQWHGIEFTTGYEIGTNPTTPGATGTVLIDAYQIDPVPPVIHSPTTEDTDVTLYETGNPYVFQLTANDGGRDGAGTVAFYVGNTPCETSLAAPGNSPNIADINSDCLVNIEDFTALASNWLNCLDTLTGNNCN